MATTWLNVDVRFRDRNTGKVRTAANQMVEVVVMDSANSILIQDVESGTHRLVTPVMLEGIRLAQGADDFEREHAERMGWA